MTLLLAAFGGFMVGGLCGIILTCLCVAAKQNDQQYDRE
jgi:hypothetical protein